MPLLSLDSRQVDVWYVRLAKADNPRLLDAYRRLLSSEEAAREQRFLAQGARLQFLAGRALIRTVLSQYAAVDPPAWVFTCNAYGKPSIAAPVSTGLEFNLSHTDGLVVCAVTWGRAVGIDVERLDRRPDALELAQRFFAPAEARALEPLPPEECQTRFLQFWTLKEALIKARGTGLSMPLDRFAFRLAAGQPPQITFDAQLGESPGDWQFAQLRVGAAHLIALAVRQPAAEPWAIRVWETVPLVWQSAGRLLPDSAEHAWTL